jgi:hypothetical protein
MKLLSTIGIVGIVATNPKPIHPNCHENFVLKKKSLWEVCQLIEYHNILT